MNHPQKHWLIIWLLLFFTILTWSAIHPHDYFTWFLEVVPALAAVIILAITYRRFPLTPLLYILILAHAVILMIGGHYTYAQVPLFNWLRDTFELSRNHYDKLGHFAQGFIPAIIARELLIRTSPLRPSKWLTVICVAIPLAVSAVYELIEWWVALATGESAEAFLGTQGYVWDTQSDMMWAGIGAAIALLFLHKFHTAQLQRRNMLK